MASSGYYTMHLKNDIMVFVCSIQCIFFKPANQKSVLFSLKNPCKERSKFGREIKHIRNLDQIPNPNNHKRKKPQITWLFWVNLKPKHQSICMRFSYLAKNLQILHWVVLRLRESPFSKEDFCNMYKIFKKFY